MSYFNGVIVANVVAFFFFLLGSWGSPISDIPDPKKTSTNAQKTLALGDDKEKKYFGASLSVVDKIATFLPGVFIWPAFYAVFFVGLPVAVGVVISTQLDDELENEDVYFVPSTDKKNGNVLMWVAVYYFALAALPTLFQCLHSFAYYMLWEKMFNIMPLSYYESIEWQAAFLGGIMMFSAVCMFSSEDALKNLEVVEDLQIAAILLPFATGIYFCYKGYIYFFDFFYFATIPGFKFGWWAAHMGCGIAMFSYIGLANAMAGYVLAATWGVFWFLPSFVWILCSSRVESQIPESGTVLREGELMPLGDGACTGARLAKGTFVITNAPTTLGTKHWFYSMKNWMMLPSSGIMSQTPTENSLDGRVSMQVLIQDPAVILERWNLGDSIGAFIVPILLPFIFFAIFIHMLHGKKKQLYSILTANDQVEHHLWITPGVGRSTTVFASNIARCIFLVDGSGVDTAVGYVFNYFNRLQNAEVSADLKPMFIFECTRMYEVAKIVREIYLGTEKIKGSEKSEENLFEFYIFYRGNLLAPEVENIAQMVITKLPGENDETIGAKRKEFMDEVIKPKLYIGKTDGISSANVSSMLEKDDESEVALISIGSAVAAYKARRMIKAAGKKKITFTDIVVEDSVYSVPMQTNPMTVFV